jgi:hypothetical protein
MGRKSWVTHIYERVACWRRGGEFIYLSLEKRIPQKWNSKSPFSQYQKSLGCFDAVKTMASSYLK